MIPTRTRRAALLSSIALAGVALAVGAFAQGQPKADPDWPCHQVKVPTFALASVWNGPAVDLETHAWRDDPEVAALVAKMTQRRVPIADVESAIADFAARHGAEARPKLLLALSGAFQELASQRAQVMNGLQRFGRKQTDMAARIRAEAEKANSEPAPPPGETSGGPSAYDRLQWDIKVFEDRHKTVSYVCETPSIIEARIGALARAVQAKM